MYVCVCIYIYIYIIEIWMRGDKSDRYIGRVNVYPWKQVPSDFENRENLSTF